ncbi:efflux transporter outer membrane subunit [Paraburkholderia bannensis]|uniref:efflux transporter outer membrane subunit n=1 Tax=Paraburkholderia bannensis TaxID=765414 RepID=UPI0005A63F70|nr:efflux transporter outer membrane subunit [Paraburkholderia bannensis]
MNRLKYFAIAVVASMLAGCDLAPVYQKPEMILPAQYSGTGPFVRAIPEDELPRGPWWTLFGDPQLSRLEARLDKANPDLAAARETWQQARDEVAQARSGLFPSLGLNAGVSENRESHHTLFHSSGGPYQERSNSYVGAASWQIDFWGETRNATREASRVAQGTAALLADARLSLELELASDYMAVWGLDRQHAVYSQTIKLYGMAVSITQMRLADKIASGLDVARAENQLASAQAADTEVLAQRGVLEHAIAVLVGANPIDFHLSPFPDRQYRVPDLPLSVPSSLLQRRPDIANAERTMAAANAAIGVSRAAFYPNIRLSAEAGFEDQGFGLASLPNALWAVGASAMLPLFEGGLRRAQLQASWSRFNEASDQYRSTVLQAFREVEDDLVLTQRLGTESKQQEAALQAAMKVQNMSLQLYTEGLDNFLNVTVAQIAALDAQIASVKVETRRLQTSVSLIGALGGGWSTHQLPTPEQTVPFGPLAYGG